MNRFGPKKADCPYCGRQMVGRLAPTREHIMPTSRGGADNASNTIFVCGQCNNLKGNLTLREFYAVICRTNDFRRPFLEKLLGDVAEMDRQKSEQYVKVLDDVAHDRRMRRMARVDEFPKEVRELVHEFGLTIIDAFWTCGVRNPRHIKHLILRVQEGSSAYGNAAKGSQFMIRNGERVLVDGAA